MTSPETTTRAEEAVRRSLRRRQDAAEAEVSRLIETGRELLSTGGDPKVAEIVKSAKVSIDAFYRYFGSKDEFVAAVADDGAARAVEYVAARMAAAPSPEARLRAAVEALMRQATNPDLAAASRNILGRAGARAQTPTGRQSFASRLAAQLAPTLEDLGAIDPARDARLATHALVGTLEGFVWNEVSPTDADVEHASGFVLRAILPH